MVTVPVSPSPGMPAASKASRRATVRPDEPTQNLTAPEVAARQMALPMRVRSAYVTASNSTTGAMVGSSAQVCGSCSRVHDFTGVGVCAAR